ncbi:chemotaxis protein MotB [Salirhabdus euzebyi]|uniref:Chemotaxis protein MotB n=1 Tax=Salirhabdus euzebyi TaxID=394506 RepID=A0A841PT30_9BACI|nr:flagellar motor protein MotS [Salirhabdus euzebyi]MBB6452137.1 chemotaxis protein MotB [Salirhabdus euzebyi]
MDYKKLRKKKKDSGSTASWMTTYADLITLVLVFFILLFSMSQIDIEKFKAVADSYRDRVIFDFNPSIVPAENPSELGDDVDAESPSELREPPANEENDEEEKEDENPDELESEGNLEELVQEVQSFLTREGLNEVISANITERGVVLILQEQILFESGEAELIEEGKPFLDKVGKLLNTIPNHVKVEGHTDSRPISTFRYPSNWELSGARASSVIRYLIDGHELDSKRFQLSSFADTRPIASNDSPENLQKNRRVEIVILEPEDVEKPSD